MFCICSSTRLGGIDTDAYCRLLGTGYARAFTRDPKEMSQVVVQDMRPPRTSPKSLEDSQLLRPNQRRVVQGWIRRCVEGGIL